MTRKLHWLTLNFKNTNNCLEKKYQEYFFFEHIKHNRWAMLISLAIFDLFALVDYILTPDGIPSELWFIRFMVVTPLALLILALSFNHKMSLYISSLFSFVYFISALGVAIMPLMMTGPANLAYFFGMGLVFSSLTNYMRVRFIDALICISLSLCSLFYILVFYMDFDLPYTFSKQLLLFPIDQNDALIIAIFSLIFGMGVFSIIGLYNFEKEERKNYLLGLQLRQQADVDGLTQIYNRQFLDATLINEFKRGRRHGTPLSIILIDIDHFKHYNDLYGHVAGDIALKKVAQSLKQCLHRPSNFVSRYGGEEFCAVLPNTENTGANQVAEILRNNVLKLEIPHDQSSISKYVTISLGVCSVYNYSKIKNIEEIIHTADIALYKAKKTGRNRFAYNIINASEN